MSSLGWVVCSQFPKLEACSHPCLLLILSLSVINYWVVQSYLLKSFSVAAPSLHAYYHPVQVLKSLSGHLQQPSNLLLTRSPEIYPLTQSSVAKAQIWSFLQRSEIPNVSPLLKDLRSFTRLTSCSRVLAFPAPSCISDRFLTLPWMGCSSHTELLVVPCRQQAATHLHLFNNVFLSIGNAPQLLCFLKIFIYLCGCAGS